MMAILHALASSFRDPSGFVFRRNNEILRRINHIYKENYDHLMQSGLYRALVDDEMLIPHNEVDPRDTQDTHAYKIIKPQLVPFISYPYEWCFSQLKDAARLTLSIQKKAFEFGMSLKDCSAFNIQFLGSRPVFIDTLSFEKYQHGQLWPAYRQFCQHFLAPLSLMSHTDIRLGQLLRAYLDGIPLDLTSDLLPFRSRFSFSLLWHIHLHARSQKRFADRMVNTAKRRISPLAFRGLIDSLESAVQRLKWRPIGTERADYYQNTNYSTQAMRSKEQLVDKLLCRVKPTITWDFGANTGLFSRIAAANSAQTIAFDIDPSAVEKHYLQCATDADSKTLPLLMDLTNPSPASGWENQERMSIMQRGPADAGLALALIHHLAIGNNLPFEKIADFFNRTCRYLIIEFVPKNDSQVQKLLTNRQDIFGDYTQEAFEKIFQTRFVLQQKTSVLGSHRTLYLMKNRSEKHDCLQEHLCSCTPE